MYVCTAVEVTHYTVVSSFAFSPDLLHACTKQKEKNNSHMGLLNIENQN